MSEKCIYTVTYNVFKLVGGKKMDAVGSGKLVIKSQSVLTNDDIYDIVVEQENLS